MPKVNVPGVKCYVSNGRAYAYDRVSGIRLTPPHTIGTPEWYRALEEARGKARPKGEKPGTWGGIVVAYRESSRFHDLAPRSQADYLKVLDYLQPLHDVPLTKWGRGFVAALRDKARKAKGRRFGNYVLSVVSVVFKVAIERELGVDVNPAADVEKVRRPKLAPRANRPWTAAEWETVVAAASPTLLPAILLAGMLGYRQGEAITTPRMSWNRKAGTLTRISAKSGKVVTVPIPAEIARALDALPPHTAPTLLVSSTGSAWTSDGFRASFGKLMRGLEKAETLTPGLTFHGLRHTVATRMRELGFDTRTIADMLGQETEGMAAHYSNQADLAPKLANVVDQLSKPRKLARVADEG